MKLTNENIQSTVNGLQGSLAKTAPDRKTQTRILLTVEEALIRFQEKFGTETEYDTSEKRFLYSIRFSIIIREKESFNPLEEEDTESITGFNLMKALTDYNDFKTEYRYSDDTKFLTISFTAKAKIPPMLEKLLILAAALVTGFIIRGAMDAESSELLFSKYFQPIQKTLSGIISAMMTPYIFFTVITGVLTSNEINELKKNGNISSKGCSLFLGSSLFPLFRSVCDI